MHLKINGDSFAEHIIEEVAAITNHANLIISDIEIDEIKQTVALPIERFKFKRRGNISGILGPYIYDKQALIRSQIIINNVLEYQIENNLSDPNINRLTILFGLTIEDKSMSIFSAEEERGKTCYTLQLKVDKIDIEISDLDVG